MIKRTVFFADIKNIRRKGEEDAPDTFFQGGNRMNTGAINQAAESAAAYSKTGKTSKVSGRTIGNPELSEKAQKYYEQLKSKFSDMDFILVSSDMKEQAEANAAQYATAGRTIVLIDEEKIEKMAEDEEYREKYEAIITNARTQLSQMQSGLGGSGVTSYGIKIDDHGNASFFAVVDKSLAAQKERIEKKAEEKKAEEKEAKKEAREQQLEEARQKKKDDAKTDRSQRPDYAGRKEDFEIVSASSVEELLSKINDVITMSRSDYVQTDAEKQIGQRFDARF